MPDQKPAPVIADVRLCREAANAFLAVVAHDGLSPAQAYRNSAYALGLVTGMVRPIRDAACKASHLASAEADVTKAADALAKLQEE